MNGYEQQALAGSTGIELVVALYDGALRFLYRAAQCVDEHDIHGRRTAVKRVTDIFIYLQTTLRTDVCAKTTAALADFYAAMFQLTLEASHYESREQFEEVIACVKEVREAWVVAARDPEARSVMPRDLRTRQESLAKTMPAAAMQTPEAASASSSWSA
ncbi:flagellar export chaperone FliS [Terriglobus tenax]|uniref:flagellar export chaperone FliS n=1 Tax=Terriglobus tenax TaxID=1111115 RepID=UPI0021DF876C|nr:flagellar export chaperone FliS [Terriglobus tenax]